MKKFVLVLLSLFIFSTAGAQMKKTKMQTNVKSNLPLYLKYLTTQLELSKEQQEKIKILLAKEEKSITEINSKYRDNKEMLASKQKEIFTQTDKQIMGVLSREQRKIFETIMPEWRKKAISELQNRVKNTSTPTKEMNR